MQHPPNLLVGFRESVLLRELNLTMFYLQQVYNTKAIIGQLMIFTKNISMESGSLHPITYNSIGFKAYLDTNPWKLGFNSN